MFSKSSIHAQQWWPQEVSVGKPALLHLSVTVAQGELVREGLCYASIQGYHLATQKSASNKIKTPLFHSLPNPIPFTVSGDLYQSWFSGHIFIAHLFTVTHIHQSLTSPTPTPCTTLFIRGRYILYCSGSYGSPSSLPLCRSWATCGQGIGSSRDSWIPVLKLERLRVCTHESTRDLYFFMKQFIGRTVNTEIRKI